MSSASSLVWLTGALTYGFDLRESMSIPAMDKATFRLLELAGIAPQGRSKQRVEFMMTAAEQFAQANSWFFLNKAYGTWSLNYLGSAVYSAGPAMFSILMDIQGQESQGATEAEVAEEIEDYVQKFSCTPSKNGVLSEDVTWSEWRRLELYVQPRYEVTVYSERRFEYILNNRIQIVGDVTRQFKSYMNAYLAFYDTYIEPLPAKPKPTPNSRHDPVPAVK